MAMEQDRESDKQVILSQVEGHRKQMLRYCPVISQITTQAMQRRSVVCLRKCVVLKFSLFCSNQTSWRKANLASKLSIDNKEKQELLCGPDGAARHR